MNPICPICGDEYDEDGNCPEYHSYTDLKEWKGALTYEQLKENLLNWIDEAEKNVISLQDFLGMYNISTTAVEKEINP